MGRLSFDTARARLAKEEPAKTAFDVYQQERWWQNAVTYAGSIVDDAFCDMANDAYDLDKRGKAVAKAIQALEQLSRQHDDITAS